MKTISFRFDIDTLTCIKSGVPKLVEISKKHNIEFTFFINFGKSINRKEVLRKKNKSHNNATIKLSTLTKLGLKNYIITLLLNPKLRKYKNKINILVNSNNEIGLHGGKNHATWQLNAHKFNLKRIEQEIEFGLKEAQKFNISLSGFTSPGMTSPELICQVLESKNFNYISDTYSYQNESTENSKKEILKNFKNINVNLVGKNGVGYFEYYLSQGLDSKEIINNLLNQILNSKENSFIIYDHPLIINFIQEEFENLIKELKKNNIKFVKMGKLK